MAWLIASLAIQAATAAPGTALDRYLTGLNSLSAAFTQTVTDSHGAQLDAGSGRLIVQRPGKFRWDYQPKDAGSGSGADARGQILVADGKNLWFYDRELAQVTVKPVEAALSSTPIVLLSGSAAQLHDSFEINGNGAHDGLDWVEVKPRSAEADFSTAALGFSGDRLERMVVNDRLGQTVQLDFSHSERNARIAADAFKFEPPKGVDVIGSAQN
ncbi:MAG TPA: outer membrane lipoprotein chaperone LolA [Steroidobacteraceae bacterium]